MENGFVSAIVLLSFVFAPNAEAQSQSTLLVRLTSSRRRQCLCGPRRRLWLIVKQPKRSVKRRLRKILGEKLFGLVAFQSGFAEPLNCPGFNGRLLRVFKVRNDHYWNLRC